MWLLLRVMLELLPNGAHRAQLLNTFDTEEECQVERDRIGFEMAKAYPYERTFEIICTPDPRKVKHI